MTRIIDGKTLAAELRTHAQLAGDHKDGGHHRGRGRSPGLVRGSWIKPGGGRFDVGSN